MSSQDEITASLESTHKRFTKHIVLPVMGIMTLAYYGLLFRPEPAIFAVMAVMIPFTLLNAWITHRPMKMTLLGRVIDLRSDGADALRWAFNLVVVDVPLILVFGPPPAVALAAWTILILSAQSDLFRTTYRNVLVGFGVAVGVALYFHLTPGQDLGGRILAPVLMVAILFVFDRMERYWVTELSERRKTELEAAEQRLRAEALERDALIGAQAKTISHELNNLITVIDFATSQRERFDFERVRRSLEFVRRINSLVLNDLRRQPQVRVVTVKKVIEDVELILRKDVQYRGVKWSVDLPAESEQAAVRERAGSLFLILRNLIKNGVDAVQGRAEAAVGIRITQTDDMVCFTVEDNGEGMPPERVNALLAQQGTTTKADGHGIGFRFVVEECERNCFQLGIDSRLGGGTRITVTSALADAEAPDAPQQVPAASAAVAS